MYISAQDEESENVIAVYLDNKRLVGCTEANEEEGWVKVYDLSNLPQLDSSGKQPQIIDGGELLEPSIKTLYGKVEILLRKEPTNG